MDSTCIYLSFTFIILLIGFLAAVFQHHILCWSLMIVGCVGMFVGAIIQKHTPINDNRTYNTYCRISANAYSRGFQEGIRITKEEYGSEHEKHQFNILE